MNLETPSLLIIPLNEVQLLQYIADDNSLEKSLALTLHPRIASDRVKQFITTRILPSIKETPQDLLFYTLWAIIDKKQNVIVADFCFKGKPNHKGEIEIGYSTFPDFQNKGIMTDAVKRICTWALKDVRVKSILAETDPDNIASNTVLEKNNFIKYNESQDNVWWRLEKSFHF
jgi:[ribosomal protein S5]-alanine N-acetyltransferase